MEMLDEVSRVSIELTGNDIGELTKEASRSEVYLENSADEANWEEMRVKF